AVRAAPCGRVDRALLRGADPRPDGVDPRRPFPGGPLLPAERRAGHDAAAARASAGRPGADGALRAALRRAGPPQAPAFRRERARPARIAELARQRPRAEEPR